ncbi:TPA: hypothetical protein N0F65_002908 [Lagenidium giganteum]|uniref:Amino acid transporter n=1 Tax=Lagenidium giganteum TaxID=4803 RepID=A0AAV2Z542_9STRA|nr:TPA: hypothetical protein N0F65_002908 [Lagenidium giganteum]
MRFGTDDLEDAAMYPDEESKSWFARFLGSSNTKIVLGVVVGVGTGFIMTHNQVAADVNELVGLPGKIFLRVLRLLVVPMVFASLTTGIGNLVQLGKASTIGVRTAIWFVTMSTICATMSLVVALALRSLQPQKHFEPDAPHTIALNVICANGNFIELVNGTKVTCAANAASASNTFELLADQITNIIFSLVPNNIVDAFQQGMVMAVITFSLGFGASVVASTETDSQLLMVLAQLNKVFFFIISHVIDWSPIGVFSLVASSFMPPNANVDSGAGSADNTSSDRDRYVMNAQFVGAVVLCNLICVLILQLVIYPTLLFVTTRRRPFRYMKHMVPCATFAFGCASSLATLPLTIRCVESTREISRTLLQFVITVGSTVHMNGTAMLFPNAIVFLASTAPREIYIGGVEMVIIVVVSALSSIGVAPIPNAGLFMVFSVWTSAFPNDDFPTTFSYLVAIYWYIDRMNTLCNVLGDTYVARIVAEQIDETFEGNDVES